MRKPKTEKHDTDRSQISSRAPTVELNTKWEKNITKLGDRVATYICGKKNHFTKMCKTRDIIKAHRVDEMSGSEYSETEFLYTVTEKPGTEVVKAVVDRKIYANMFIDNKPRKFYIEWHGS